MTSPTPLACASSLWGIPLLALALGCGAEPAPRVETLGDHYDQIQGGMSLAEVQSLLGPGRPLTLADDLVLHIRHLPSKDARVWQDGRTSITIAFAEGKSVAKLRAVAPAKDH